MAIQMALKNYDQIIVPINLANEHWLTVVLDVGKTNVIFMDSLPEGATRSNPNPVQGSRTGKIMQESKAIIHSRTSINHSLGAAR
jgi:Ulp1 family protease